MIQIKSYEKEKIDHNFRPDLKAGLFFWHGLGDLIMFMPLWRYIKNYRPNTRLILQKGIGQEVICPDALLVSSETELEKLGLDIIFHVHFPLSEFDKEPMPKVEKCCRDEFGISPVIPAYYPIQHKNTILSDTSKYIGVCFQVTALPDSGNVGRDEAKIIWETIQELGYIPIETTIEHPYHNPKNTKYDFIDCTLRSAKIAGVAGLISALDRCFAFLGVSTGVFPLSLTRLPHYRIAHFEKHMPLAAITREKMKVFKIGNIKKDDVKAWVEKLS